MNLCLEFNLFRNWDKTVSSYESIVPTLSSMLYGEVIKRNGSISAEHGIGRLKVSELNKFEDPGKLYMMRLIKSGVDPQNLLNPGVIF